MASSLYSNAQHVDFESGLGMDDPGMVSMFEALMASGLRGFLGCPAVVYEDALVDFFENASVRNGVVFSTVGGQIVQISEKLFAETFELPVDGLGVLSEMPKDAIFDARSIVSLSGEQINLSGRKNQMKMPYRLLCDIVAKAISVKAGSFNAITVEKFSLMTAVVCGVKMNWAKFLFGVLKKMVAAKSKQAKGFAIQISLLLATFPAVELGEASAFPASKILSKKTVLRFVSINDRDGAEEITGAAKKKAVSKKRTAADIEEAVPKKKRSLKKKSISSLELVEVAEEALLHKIEQNVRDSLIDQAAVFKSLSQEARQENRTLDDVQTIRFNEFRKHVLAQNASIFIGLADVRKEVDAIHAKVDIMASRLNDIQKDAEATKEAHSNQLFEFQSQAQENHNVIHAQLSELVDYIHRGRADKKGESGSRGPQQPAATQITGSAVTPTFEQRVQMAQRRIVQTVLDADANRALSQEAAERDRERRRKEARSLKRRRKD
ncbi:dystroglycan-like [Dorcoceras hygrometricum]|uniref:Dystroglycan-like n=1 Tax=Dorcoceras hygrometricum TaxID=472368 RepID=A0A2Z7BFG3_9LAMI|nr:dystroglycan-like [Dorcoceras hygrometricum]